VPISEVLLLAGCILVASLLYSSVGHGGASGYLAAMALFGLAPGVMRPTALVLNLLVAAIATVQFARAGHFSWRLFWPFAAGSVPFAFVGGTITLPTPIYKQVLGVVLLFAAYRLFLSPKTGADATARRMPIALAILIGCVIGLLSGLTGVGGGIFLSPLLLVGGWAPPKPTAAVSAAFIWVNSASGLLGQFASVHSLPAVAALWAVAAATGGAIGAGYGSRRLAGLTLRRLLAAVLVVAGFKMLLT
jgi:uncharacterized membrane protein YfcA